MSSKRKRIRVKVSELLKKIEEKKAPRLVGIIPPYFGTGMAQLELESERSGIEEFRKYVDSKREGNLITTPKLGTVFYCGTGGSVTEVKRIFENPDTNDKYPLSEKEYMDIIKSGEWLKS